MTYGTDLTAAFFANDPKSYSALEMRKKIALAQMMQRRAFPKNFGEGLSAVGEAIGERGTMAALERQQAEYDARRLAEKKAEESGDKRGPLAYGDDDDTVERFDKEGARFIPPRADPLLEPQADPNRRVIIQTPPPRPVEDAPQPAEVQIQNTEAPIATVQPRSLQPPPAPAALAQSMSPSQNPLLNQYPVEPQANAPFPGPDVAQPQVPQSVAMRQPAMAPPPQGPGPAQAPAWFGQTVANGQRMAGPQPIGGSPGPAGVPQPGLQAMALPPPDPRTDIAMSLAQRGPGGPPPNPMLGGAIPAAMPKTLMSGGGLSPPPTNLAAVGSPPEAAGNRPIVMRDIEPGPRLAPGAQLAQAIKAPNPMEGRPRVYVQEPSGPAQGVQVPQVRPAPEPATTPGAPERGQAPAVYDRPVEPKPFARTADPPDLTRFKRNEQYADDPDMKAYWKSKADNVEKQRAAVDERLAKEYENKYNAYIQADQAWLTHQRNLPKTQADTSQAQSEASIKADQAVISARHGGIPAEKVFADLADRQKLAKSAADTLKQAKIARQALDAGIFSGPFANLQLDKARLESWMLKNKAAGDLASNAEMFRTATNSMLGQAVKNFQPGGGPVTEGDIKIASGQVGSTPELMEQTKRKILNNFISQLHGDLADYEDRVGRSLGGLKAEQHFGVERPPLHNDPTIEKQYIDRLLEHKDNLAARNRFDELFGPGAAALEIARAKRRGGR